MTLPQSIPDLPDKLQQHKDWEQWTKNVGKDKAKDLIGFAKYSPMAVVVPFVQWLIGAWPDAWLISADGRGEAEFHYYVPKILPFDATSWEKIDGDTWYFTRRNDRFGDIAYNYLHGLGDMSPLYQAQSDEWKNALPWRVTLWEDTPLPANFPIKIPEHMMGYVVAKHALQFTPDGHGKQGIPGKPGLNIDAPPQAEPNKKVARGKVDIQKGVETYDKGGGSGSGALVIGGLALVAVLALKGRG